MAFGGGFYRGGTLQHWYFTAVGMFSSKDLFKSEACDLLPGFFLTIALDKKVFYQLYLIISVWKNLENSKDRFWYYQDYQTDITFHRI